MRSTRPAMRAPSLRACFQNGVPRLPPSWFGEKKLWGQKPSSLGRQIGSLPQESVGDDELAVSVPRMCSRTISHSAKKPAAIQRGDCSQLVMAAPPNVAEVLGQRAV